jgi:hypothetical protein
MTKKIILSSLIFVTLILMCQSCQKKVTQSVDNESQSIVDNVLAEQEFMALIPAIHQLAINSKGTGAQAPNAAIGCDSLTKISGDTLYGSVLHIDPTYSVNLTTTFCNKALPDGKLRFGTLKIRFTNKLRLVGAKMIVKMSAYQSNDLQYACDSMIVTTISTNSLSTTFNVKIIRGSCQTSRWSAKYSCDQTITNYVNGNPVGTEPYATLYGQANGINRHGSSYLEYIPASNPLIKHKNCPFFDRGTAEITPEGFSTRTIDYGNGICDKEATFIINGNSIAFNLK